MPPSEAKVKMCSRPGCFVQIKPGQLACREHWFELPSELRDRLVYAWEQRKAHPDVPELVHAHRALLLECMKAWKIPLEVMAQMLKTRAPKAVSTSCPWCGAPNPFHRPGCRDYPNEEGVVGG